MSLFAIADLHLSLASDKPMDIFKGWSDYVKRLEKNWRAIVKDKDTVVIAGDVSWALKLEETKKDFEFLNNLPGKKIIIKGNHDYWWSTVSKMRAFVSENGFDTIDFLNNNAFPCGDFAVCGTRGWFFDDENTDQKILLREVGRLKTSIQEAKKTSLAPVAFLHYPPVYQGTACKEILNVLTEEKIRRCYYGHIHGAGSQYAVRGEHYGINFYLISCDFLEFTPLLLG